MKIDFIDTDKDDIEKLAKRFKREGKLILAEKVETIEEFEWAKGQGFDYFQGYYFEKPSIKNIKKLDNNAIQYIKLMAELNKEEPDYNHLANIIKLDIALTIKILKLVNSFTKTSEPIESIKHALVFLGVATVKKWLSLAVVQNLAKPETYEISKYAFARSYFLENASSKINMESDKDGMALLGSISILDRIFNQPMVKLVDELPISRAIRNALINVDDKFTHIFNMYLAYEKGEFILAEDLSKKAGYEFEQLQVDYIESVKWAEKTFDSLNRFKH